MKTRWIIEKMSLLPRWTSSLSYSFKTLASPNPSLSRTPCFVLNHVDLSTLLSTCGREGHLRLGSSLHAAIIKIPEFIDPGGSRTVLVVWNSLLSMYSKCGQLYDADKLFDNMPVRDAVSWNSIISGFLRNGELEIGFEYFKRMHNSGIYRFDEATLTTILSTFDGPNFIGFAKTIHGLVFLTGFETEITVGNALITSYFKCKCSVSGRQVFDEMMEKNVITWTAAISGLANNEWYEESLKLFIKMRNGTVNPNSLTYLSSLLACSGLQSQKEGSQIHGLLWKLGIQSDLCVESALMDMYCKCKNMEDAFKLFEWAEVFDEVSMTVILVGFAQNGFQVEAIQIFSRIVKSGIEIDVNIVSAILGLFGTDTCLGLGRQIHSLAIKKNFVSNIFVSNGLINMYSKCGDLDESEKIFDKIPQKNQISWNSMIAAFARHGAVSRALDLYEEMKFHGVEPSDVTFLSLLHVCAHVGLVEKGMEFFQSMSKIHNIVPRMEHYACVVDLLGRAGLLNEAKDFIEGMPVKPGPLVWQALLGACSFHRESDIGKYAAEELSSADPNSHSPYILMANIYSHEGRWRERARTIRRMREMGVGSKETGMSWIEIKKEVHGFVVGDGMHWRGEAIYGVLLGLFGHMMDEGYVPDKRFLLCYYLDSDEEEEEEALKAS